jgi:ribosomal protein S18 acetylase RimI-like enzyme
MKIRPARRTDTTVIADFNARIAWETERRRLDPARVRRGVAALLRDRAKGFYFVAEEKRAVVGQLLITSEWSDWRNGNFWWIQSVYVAPEFRQAGVFRALFAHVHQLAKSRREVCGLRLYVDADNTRAQNAYERLGMKRSHYQIFEEDFKRR